PLFELCELRLVDVHANDVTAGVRKARAGDETYVSSPDYCNLHISTLGFVVFELIQDRESAVLRDAEPGRDLANESALLVVHVIVRESDGSGQRERSLRVGRMRLQQVPDGLQPRFPALIDEGLLVGLE